MLLSELKLAAESFHAFFVALGLARRKPRKAKASGRQMDDPDVYKPVLYGISCSMIFRALASNLLTASRVSLMIRIFEGQSSLAALELGKIRAAGAFLEFLVGPFFGNLSDAYGRKFGMMPSAIMNVFSSALVWMNPMSLYAHWTLVLNIALDTAFFAQIRAQMADCMTGRNIAENAFMHMAPAGLAMIAAPWIGGRLKPSQCYATSSVLSAISVWVLYNQEETLDLESRRSIEWAACNPLAFITLFTHGDTLRALTLTSGIQTYTDSRLMENVATLMAKEKLNYSDRKVSGFLTRIAFTNFLGVPLGKYSIKMLGRTLHTRVSHAVKVVAYFVWARLTGSAMRYAQWILMFAARQRDGVETLITEIGVAKGFGKGQVEAYKMNWRSVTNFLAPLVYSNVFVYGKRWNILHLPLYAAIGFTLASELIFTHGLRNYFQNEKGLEAIVFD